MPASPAFSTEDASLLSSERDMLGGRRIEMRIPSDCRRGGVAERGSSVSSSHGSDLNRGTSDNGVMNGKLHEHSMRGVAILSVLAGAVFLVACGSGAIPRRQPEPGATQPVALHHSPSTPASPGPMLSGSDAVTLVREPNTYAYRNYCVPGAIAMLLSVWTPQPPSLDAIAVEAKLEPDFGVWGSDAVTAINHYLIPIIGAGKGSYAGSHLTSMTELMSAVEASVPSGSLLPLSSHGTPVLVHFMTGTLPGWHGYEAQHMVAIIGYSFTGGSPTTDTVTYAESAGSVAGYNGPGTETVTLAELWTAILAYHRDATDPVDMIAFQSAHVLMSSPQ